MPDPIPTTDSNIVQAVAIARLEEQVKAIVVSVKDEIPRLINEKMDAQQRLTQQMHKENQEQKTAINQEIIDHETRLRRLERFTYIAIGALTIMQFISPLLWEFFLSKK